MKTISERISEIIEYKKMTKTEFADKINVTQAYISKIVNTGATPSDRLLEDICEKFGINEIWLRTGEGDMFNPDPDDELAWIVGQVFSGGDEFKKAFVTELLKMDDEGWKYVKGFINGITNRMK